MNRIAITIAVAFAIIWQSNCLSIDGWSIYNRCGLWQLLTQSPMVISLGDLPTQVVEHTKIVKEVVKEPGEPTVVYVPQPQPQPGTTCTTAMSTTTSSMSAFVYMNPGNSGIICSNGPTFSTTTTGVIMGPYNR